MSGRSPAAFQSALPPAVLLPESFRGGCSFGAAPCARPLLRACIQRSLFSTSRRRRLGRCGRSSPPIGANSTQRWRAVGSLNSGKKLEFARKIARLRSNKPVIPNAYAFHSGRPLRDAKRPSEGGSRERSRADDISAMPQFSVVLRRTSDRFAYRTLRFWRHDGGKCCPQGQPLEAPAITKRFCTIPRTARFGLRPAACSAGSRRRACARAGKRRQSPPSSSRPEDGMRVTEFFPVLALTVALLPSRKPQRFAASSRG